MKRAQRDLDLDLDLDLFQGPQWAEGRGQPHKVQRYAGLYRSNLHGRF